MKNRILTTSIREIKSSFKRFLSLFVMSLLGVGVFVGITATPGDMLTSIDKYYDDSNLYDIKIVSTLGLTDNDIKALDNLKTIKKSYGTYSKDVLTTLNKVDTVVKYISITDNYNKIELKKGTLPKNQNEVIVEEALLSKNNLKIGDYITVDDKDIKSKKLKIVGVVKSPLYIGNVTAASDRGNTNIGTGKINYYAYLLEDAFSMDYYTESYILVNNAKTYTTNSDKYLDLIDNTISEINTIKKEREKDRYQEIYNKANNEIQKEKSEGLTKLNSGKKELDDANIKLLDGKKKLDDSKSLLDNSKLELDKTKQKLISSKQELDNGKKELDLAKAQIDEGKQQINELLTENNLTYEDLVNINNKINDLETFLTDDSSKEEIINRIPNDIPNYEEIITLIDNFYDLNLGNEIIDFIKDTSKIEGIIENIPEDNPYYEEIVTSLNLYKDNKEKLLDIKNSIDKLENGEKEYLEGLDKYNEGLKEYEKGNKTYLEYVNKYEEGLETYNKGLKEYNNSYNLYQTGLEEYYKSRKIFDEKIKDAEDLLKSINKCEWYINDRMDDSYYSQYIEDGNSIKNLSKVFPSIFFIVAILISLISMSRMVEDDRMLIGTLKSLGFSNKHIRLKYVLYSGIATISGALVGSLLGFYLLPYYIWGLYKMLFVVEIFEIEYNFTHIIIGTLLAIICICGTTLITIKKVVKEKPSELMRPVAPSNGKRVILEHIPFIWNRISFSNKVTIRNLFRYKKRVIMTIVGILGCTSLLLVGFGLRDSIVDIPDMQYGKVFNFDEMVYLLDDNNINDILDNKQIKNYTKTKMATGTSLKYSVNLFVPEEEKDLKNILSLKNLKTSKNITLKDNEVVITDKLAELVNVKEDELIIYKDSTGKEYKFKVSEICENYAGNYIFMNKKTYEQKIEKYNTNVIYLNLKDINKEESFTKELINKDNVMSVVSSTTTLKTIRDMLKTLDSVVLLLIFLSGALSFVVLYNLSYINISERKREIATLKVLGFTNKEVDNYINKETIILTIIGIILGLLLGIVLTNFIVTTVEVDMVRFIRKINALSFILSALMTIIFTIIVNIIIHFTLKKIDMIESLKSVE